MKLAANIFYILCFLGQAQGQTLGGNSAYNFLRLSNTPQLTGLGGVNISNQSGDVGMVFSNPALIRKTMHLQGDFVFNAMYAGIRNYQFLLAFNEQKTETNFAAGINYLSYGNVVETDPAGNIYGDFKPVDYVIQLSASRLYKARWYYGATVKFIYSQYARYRSSGMAIDVGLSYTDSANLFQGSLVIKNMGVQIKSYNSTSADDLPFDVQAGFSKRLAKAPLQFSLTAHHLHRFDIGYHDTLFNNEYFPAENLNGKKFTLDKLFRHFVLSSQMYIEEKVEISVGYNYLRRKELSIGTEGNGFNGFSLGLGLLFRNLQLRYGRSYYQNNTAYNQFGLNLRLGQYFSLRRSGRNNG